MRRLKEFLFSKNSSNSSGFHSSLYFRYSSLHLFFVAVWRDWQARGQINEQRSKWWDGRTDGGRKDPGKTEYGRTNGCTKEGTEEKTNYRDKGSSIYDVYTCGGHPQVNACEQGRESAPCGRPYRKLQPTDVILHGAVFRSCKEVDVLRLECRIWMEWKAKFF